MTNADQIHGQNEEVKASASPTEEIENQSRSILDVIETWLEKMILGVPKFIFMVLPPKVWHFITRTFPWLAKIIKITALFVFWLVLVFWPVVLLDIQSLRDFFLVNNLQGSTMLDDIIFTEHSQLALVLSCVWIGLAILGSIWGLGNITIKKIRKYRLRKIGEN